MTRHFITGLLLISAALAIGCAPSAEAGLSSVLQPVRSIALPGSTSRFDYESIDPARRLLFIAHLGDSSIVVFDLKTGSVRKVISGISNVHGLSAVPQRDRLYASATGTDEVAVIDEQTLQVVAHIPGGDYPDGIAYAAPEQKIYISDEHGGTDTVADVPTNAHLATIPLGGEAGNTQFDPASNRIYVNAQTADELVTIDPRADRITGRRQLPHCKNNHGLLLNTHDRVAYIACDENATLLTYDLRTRKVTAEDRVGDGPDVLAYDAKDRRLYVSAESGAVAVFSVGANGALSNGVLGFLAPNAHSVAVDPATGFVYFPIQSAGGKPQLQVYRPINGE